MTKEEAIEWLKSLNYCDGEETQEVAQAINMAIKALEQQPSDESIKYLECNGIDVQKFTEALKMQPLQVIKPNISDDCVSRQAVIEYIKNCGAELGHDCENEIVVEDILNLPSVTPTQCIATVQFSKEDLREICNERIEIERTHGACKNTTEEMQEFYKGEHEKLERIEQIVNDYDTNCGLEEYMYLEQIKEVLKQDN